MSSKSKWDQPADVKAEPSDSQSASSKSASDAAATAAAIAAKIAAQLASGALKDPNLEAAFSQDIDINDVRNRYMLTKGTTQQEIHEETGANVSTKGIWYPDRSRATERDPPLHLHITAATKEQLQKAIDRVNELIAIDLGSLVDDKGKGNKRRWPEAKLPVNLETIRNFNVRAKVVGHNGSFVKYIQQETGTRVQIKGIGSGFNEPETGKESEEPLYIHVTGPEEGQVARAKVLAEDLLLVVRSEHAKMATLLQQQQMELHQAQLQYAQYSAMMAGYGNPTDPSQPGAPPADPAAAGAQQAAQMPPDPSNAEAYKAYWAAYGYDVNSPEFQAWQQQQQQQYSQYYTQQPQEGAQPAPPAPAAPAPPSGPPPPPPS